MSKNNAKGLTTLRQKLKKYNRDFESDIATYREVTINLYASILTFNMIIFNIFFQLERKIKFKIKSDFLKNFFIESR